MTQGDPFEPVKIGLLIDMDNGQLVSDWVDASILAIEDALNEGVYDRPVRLVVADARGLPRENLLNTRRGYEWLCDQGCVLVLGPEISDNSLQIQFSSIAAKWPASHGPVRGDSPASTASPSRTAMCPLRVSCAEWLKAQGHQKIGMFWEQGSSGRDYAGFFREEAERLGLVIARDVKLGPNPRGLTEHLLARCERTASPRCYYGGYGYSTFHFAKSFAEIDWDPPRVMGTAFMFYSNTNEWAAGLEGWHGVDQLGEDGTNPNYDAMIERFQEALRSGLAQRRGCSCLRHSTCRYSRDWQCRMATPEEVKEGLERIRWMPATNGGPATYIQFGPWDHKGYKGDFLNDSRVAGWRIALRRLPPTRVSFEQGNCRHRRKGAQ